MNAINAKPAIPANRAMEHAFHAIVVRYVMIPVIIMITVQTAIHAKLYAIAVNQNVIIARDAMTARDAILVKPV